MLLQASSSRLPVGEVATPLLIPPPRSRARPSAIPGAPSKEEGTFPAIEFARFAAHAAWENDLVRLEGAMFACLAFGVLELGALLRFPTAEHPVTAKSVLDWTDARTWLYAEFLVSIRWDCSGR